MPGTPGPDTARSRPAGPDTEGSRAAGAGTPGPRAPGPRAPGAPGRAAPPQPGPRRGRNGPPPGTATPVQPASGRSANPAATPADVPARRPADHAAADQSGRAEDGEPVPGSRRRDPAERGLRGLVAAGPSQVGVIGAMRARDAARPRPEDLAAAERELTIVRRYYVPPEGSSPASPGPDPE
jgi:hypothetical protein